MKLYWLAAENRYVHRQSDIPKGVAAEPQDIPTDLAGLMAHLNDLHAARNCAVVDNEADMQRVLDAGGGVGRVITPVAPYLHDLAPAPEKNAQEIEAPPAPIVPPPPDMTATAVLSRCDNPGTNVDAVVETICKAKGYALKRYAGAVATAFHQLEKK